MLWSQRDAHHLVNHLDYCLHRHTYLSACCSQRQMRFSSAIMLVAAVVVLACTPSFVIAQSVDVTGDVPGVRFTAQDVQSCDPLTQVLADPRASGFKSFVKELGQNEGASCIWGC